MRFRSFFPGVLREALALLLGGESCVRCGFPSGGMPLCRSCRDGHLFRWVPSFDSHGRQMRCGVCGAVLVSELEVCGRCRREPLLLHTDRVLPVHSYSLWKRDLLVRWKLHGMRQMSGVFADLLAAVIRAELCPDGRTVPVVPVPPRPGKIRSAGWDQVDELCRCLSRRHGFRVLPLLERLSATQQKKLSRQGRLDTLDRAYRLRADAFASRLVPKSVVLVDDVMTTGVTVETCAHCLKEAGVETVFALTLFSVS